MWPVKRGQCRQFVGVNDETLQWGNPQVDETETARIPLEVGAYRIKKLLGEGAYGAVYLAIDSSSGEEVALKVLTQIDADSLQRIKREAAALERLRHPGIVGIHEINEADGVHFISMQYVPGETLSSMDRVSLNEALRICHELCVAVGHAHDQKTVHRDIKPANILLNSDTGRAMLVDFGLAKEFGRSSGEQLTTVGAVMGTPGYMSPEQARGDVIAFESSDIYALGATLYYLVTGQCPLTGETLTEALFKTLRGDFPRPSKLNIELPREVEAIVLKAMMLDSKRRYASCYEMGDEIQAFLNGEPVQSVFEIFSDSINHAQAAGWRVRRKIMVVASNGKLSEKLSVERLGRYEIQVLTDIQGVFSALVDQSFDAVVCTDSLRGEMLFGMYDSMQQTQPNALRLFIYESSPSIATLKSLVNTAAIDFMAPVTEDGDSLGEALDSLFLNRDESLSEIALRDEVLVLRRTNSFLEQSLVESTKDMQAKAEALGKQQIELRTLRKALFNVSMDLKETRTQLDEKRHHARSSADGQFHTDTVEAEKEES